MSIRSVTSTGRQPNAPVGSSIGSFTGAGASGEQGEGQAVEDVGFAHQAGGQGEGPHDLYEDAHAAHDDVGPGRFEAGVLDPLGQRLGGQGAEDVLGGRLGEAEVVDAVAVVGGQAD